MVKVQVGVHHFSLDGYLKAKLDNIKYILKKNWDAVLLIDGKERSGKSTLGKQIAQYLYPPFSIDNMAVDLNDAKKKIETLPDKSCLFIDEGSMVFNSKDAMNKAQKQLMKIMDVVGQKNMIFIVVLPSFFDLNKTIAVRRSRFLLHVYTDRKLNRGRFCYFGERKKGLLYELGKKRFGSYSKPKADFYGSFTAYDPLGKEYLELKKQTLLSALHEPEKEMSTREKRAQTMLNILIAYIYQEKILSQVKLSKLFIKNGIEITSQTLGGRIKGLKVKT